MYVIINNVHDTYNTMPACEVFCMYYLQYSLGCTLLDKQSAFTRCFPENHPCKFFIWLCLFEINVNWMYLSLLLHGEHDKASLFQVVQYRVSQKRGNPFYQWDIFIVAQVFIKLYASCSRAFSILSFDTKHNDDISIHDWKGTIWTHACQNRVAQNNGVELIWPSSD